MRVKCDICNNFGENEEIIVFCKPCYKVFRKENIEEFLESYEKLRDFVLNAPILTGDVYILKDYLCSIRDRLKVEIDKWEGRLKE